MSDCLLLVEDEEWVKDALELILPDIQVVWASSREDALRVLQSRDDWLGVLIDLNLSGPEGGQDFRGLAVIEYLQSTDIPRAIFSGADVEGDHVRLAEEWELVAFIAKDREHGRVHVADIRRCVERMRELRTSSRVDTTEDELGFAEVHRSLNDRERLLTLRIQDVAAVADSKQLARYRERRLRECERIRGELLRLEAEYKAGTPPEGLQSQLTKLKDELASLY